jgi:hypothetical protein
MVLQGSFSAGRANFRGVLENAEATFLSHILDRQPEFFVFLRSRNKTMTKTCSKRIGSRSRLEEHRRWGKH